MAARNTEILVGITVLLALAIVVWSVTFLREVRIASSTTRWVARFDDVGGLAVDDPVTVSGVKKGAVKGIALDRGQVLVQMLVEKDVAFTTTTRIYVRNVGLMGEKFIAVDPFPGGKPLAAGRDTIVGQYESGIPEVISQMGDALSSLEHMSQSLDRVIALAEERNTLRTTLANVEQSSAELRRTLVESRADLAAIRDNLRATSETTRRLVEDNGPRVAQTFDDMARTQARLDSTLAHIDSLAVAWNDVADKVGTGNSTAARLVNERELYDDLRASVREFGALVRDLRANPRKYLKISVF
jgi:phospholipid/cholesterol/gamma-HCH transport system substrate-binding protein